MDALLEAKQLKEQVIEIRRHFHQHPETSGNEFATADYIANFLDQLGIPYKRNVGAPLPGIVALIEGKYPGKTIALRADMDALKQQELRECSYKSENDGAHHGCGHDVHMAVQLGTAVILAKHKDELHGNVKLIFQPCEEASGGAEPMIQDGCLENPKVDEIFGLHVDSDVPVGKVLLSYGKTYASSDRLFITVHGKSSHGAYPHRGIDAIVVASHIMVALQSLISREKDALSPAILSLGMINGGTAPNIVCNEVELKGILRTLDETTREDMLVKIKNLVEGVAMSLGASATLKRIKSHSSLVNHNDSVNFQKEVAQDLFGAENVMILEQPKLITEDFSHYLYETEGAFWMLGTGNKEKDTCYPLHSTHFDVDEDAIVYGMAMQAALAYKRLEA